MDLEEEDLVLQAAVGGNLVDHVEGTCLYMGYLPLHLHFFNMFVRKENVEPKKDQIFLKTISSPLEVKFSLIQFTLFFKSLKIFLLTGKFSLSSMQEKSNF